MTLDYRPRTISLCLNIDGFVRNNRYPRGYDIFQRDDGTPLTAAEARAFLALEKAKGRHVIPMSAECGNPCKNAAKGCTGFDYGERGGCPGRYSTPTELGEL
jgi:hypothetical protein